MTSTDTLAFGVLHAAYSLGRAVPGDLSVVGFDDILLASHTVPALTTLRMPTADDRRPRASSWPSSTRATPAPRGRRSSR